LDVFLSDHQQGTMNWVPLLIFVVIFGVITTIGVYAAPYFMYRELESETNELRIALDNRKRRQEALARLWKLRADGVQLRNEAVNPNDFASWKARHEQWHSKVLEEAEALSLNFSSWLDTLDRVRKPVRYGNPPVNSEHEALRNHQGEVLLRMQEFLQAQMLGTEIKNLEPYT
jgi:hypothetical protein